MKPITQSITKNTTEVLGPSGEIIPASIDDIVKTIQEMVTEKGFVLNSAIYRKTAPLVEAYLDSACQATVLLLQKGAGNGGIDSDKYNLLDCKATDFGAKNGIVNNMLTRLAKKRKAADDAKAAKALAEGKEVEPLSMEEKAKLVAEPIKDNAPSEKADITTTDGGRFVFDKVNYKITLYFTDGTTKELSMAPQGTWRNTALNWIVAFCRGVKQKVVKAAKAVSGFFGRLNPFKVKADDRIPTSFDEFGNPIYAPEIAPPITIPADVVENATKPDKPVPAT